jgi:hypothetical protein
MKQPFWNNIIQPSAIKFAMTNFVPGTEKFGTITSISETGEYVASTCRQTGGSAFAKGAIAIYNTFSRSQVGYYLYPGTESQPFYNTMKISGNGLRTIGGIFGGYTGTTTRVNVINNTNASLVWQFDVPSFIEDVYISPDGNLVAVKYINGTKLRTYNVSTQTMLREFTFTSGNCVLSSSGTYVIGSSSGSVSYTLYDPSTGATLGTIPFQSNAEGFPVISLNNTIYGYQIGPGGSNKVRVYKMFDNTLLAEKTLDANFQNIAAWSGDTQSFIAPLQNERTSFCFSSIFNSGPSVKISDSQDFPNFSRYSISANGSSFAEGRPGYNSNQGIVYLY